MNYSHALILNASFEPLHIVSWQRALQLLFQGKVEVIEESSQEIRTVRISIKIPSVLRLINYVHLNQKKQLIKFSRTNVFIRDSNTCQYCNEKYHRLQLTLDHVVPVVQGGTTTWENIVTACRMCNQKKGGKTPSQAKMKLHKTPQKPLWLPSSIVEFRIAITPERWKRYLQNSEKKGG